MAVWRALGDARPAGGTKARQKRIEAVRAEGWEFARKGEQGEHGGEESRMWGH